MKPLGAVCKALTPSGALALAQAFCERARTSHADALSEALSSGTRIGAAFDVCAFVLLAKLAQRGLVLDVEPEVVERLVACLVHPYEERVAGFAEVVEKHCGRYEAPPIFRDEDVEVALEVARLMLRDLPRATEAGVDGLGIAAAIKTMTREGLDALLDGSEGMAEQFRTICDVLAAPETKAELGDDGEPASASLMAFARELATTPLTQRQALIERHLNAPAGRAPVGQLPRDKAAVLRALELQELPRIGTSPIHTRERLVRRVEDIALELGDWHAQRIAAINPSWWRVADLLDDVMDVLDALNGPLGTVEGRPERLADLLSRITPENCHAPVSFGSEDERRFQEECDKVGDGGLVARSNSAPDIGGALPAELMTAGEPAYEGDQPLGDRSKSVFLLFRDEQSVQWSLDRIQLEQALSSVLADGGCFAHNWVLELGVSAELAQRLMAVQCPELDPPHVPNGVGLTELARYRDKARAYVRTRPDLLATEGLRVYLTFLSSGACRWSPSGNNIDSIISRAPSGTFLCNAQRLELTDGQYVDLYAYFEWACDSF